MLAITSAEWTAVFTGATALFGCVVAVVTFMAYRHNRHQSGLRRPIRASKEDYWHPGGVEISELPPAIIDTRNKRIATVRFANRSDVDIRWSIDRRRTRLFRATLRSRPVVEDPGLIATAKHDGTNVALVFTLDEGDEWSSNELDPAYIGIASKLLQKYWLRVCGFTADGHKVMAFRRVELIEIYPLVLPS